MAQIITNTFFDDCESIQNVDGIPVLDFDDVVDRSRELGDPYVSDTSVFVDVANAEKYGLSKRLLRGIPNSLFGCMLSSKRNKIAATFSSILYGDPEIPDVSDTATGIAAGPRVAIILAYRTLDPESGKETVTFGIESA